MKTVDFNGKPFHFIGIGGIGMSALAYILAKRQLPVSGSDLKASHITQRLQAVGAQVFKGQEAANLKFFQSQLSPSVATNGNGNGNGNGKHHHSLAEEQLTHFLPQIICSTAISTTNSEYQAAKTEGYPIFHRSDVLAALIKEYNSVAVAGTHGKTTTSSLLGYILLKAGLDPTIIVGGEVDAWEGNARVGDSNYLVAEADESDGSLTKHCPKIGIVTNIELDHPDHYQSLAEVVEIFRIFEKNSELLIGCIDCDTVRTELSPQITYGLDSQNNPDYTVTDVTYHAGGSTAQVWEKGQSLGEITLQLPGKHNLSNTLAAIAVGRQLGLTFSQLQEAIASFSGAKRRFEFKGEANGITLIDDYAHHPSEIKVTLAAAQDKVQQGQYQRVVAIFQPHRYSRTATFLEEFAMAFSDADVVVATDIYSAGETPISGIDGEMVAQNVKQHHGQVHYHPNLKLLPQTLTELLKPGDLVLFLGAGNLNQTIPMVLEELSAA